MATLEDGFKLPDKVDGNYPKRIDGGYPLIYSSQDGLILCADCASVEDTPDPVTHADIFYEGEAEFCDDCGECIESAYGPVE